MDDLDINHGTLFPSTVVTIAIIIGVILILLALPIGLILLPITSYFALSKKGVRFNKTEGWFQSYTSAYALYKFGKKRLIKNFQYVTVRPAKETITGISRANVSSSQTTYYFEVLIFDVNRKNKQVVKKYPSMINAEEWAKDFCKEYNFEYIEYSPPKRRKR